jgi:hypothetical protein
MSDGVERTARPAFERFPENPLIGPDMDTRMGRNINGASLLRVPEWLEGRLGTYYLYFAHHQGSYIRLAYADDLAGPWQIYEPGVLDLADSHFQRHIASPDVHVDAAQRQIRMYYHGVLEQGQRSRLARSTDGLQFTAGPEILGPSYFRVFKWRGWHYALAMPGEFYRSRDGVGDFEAGPTLFSEHMRHSALRLAGDTLYVYYSNAFDCPERILLSRIELTDNWRDWRESEPELVLQPELGYEGADLTLEPSRRGSVKQPVRQLRDPCIYEEGGRIYLFYSVAGESGIAGAVVDATAESDNVLRSVAVDR